MIMNDLKLVIGHLYPDLMDTYGDRGNIIALSQRCKWRGITVEYRPLGIGSLWELDKIDLFFFGGGQDQSQSIVGHDLMEEKAKQLSEQIEKGKTLLAICGGYQLLGRYYQPKEGSKIVGAGIFDCFTQAGEKRMIGNILIDTTAGGIKVGGINQNLIGFENHSGKTYLGAGVKALGKVQIGFGNNGEDGWEGAVYKGAIGCYMHGSLLPKNPHLADYLLQKTLEVKYRQFALEELDDSLEWQTHYNAIQITKQKNPFKLLP